MTTCDQTSDLRRMSPLELEQLGQQSLRDHLLAQAVVAHQKHGPFTASCCRPGATTRRVAGVPQKDSSIIRASLDALLHDPDCLRYPVRLVFEFGEMAMHQFAQPEIDWRSTDQGGRVLYLRPNLRERSDLLPLAVAYMIPVINYGEIISDEHCLAYGATLLGLMEPEYHEKLCALADEVGAERRVAGQGGRCPERPCS